MRFGGVAARPLEEPCVRCDPGDVGNWADWVGTLALIVEATLITISRDDRRDVLGSPGAGGLGTDTAELMRAGAAHTGDTQQGELELSARCCGVTPPPIPTVR